MKSVYFHTDESVHKKFKMVCAINEADMGKTMTELMKKYVKDNEELISSPQIQGKIPPEIPSFYAEQEDWRKYVNRARKLEIENFATRITFLRYLLHIYLIDSDKDFEIYQSLHHPEYFKESDDYKFLHKNKIIHSIREIGSDKKLPSIKVI
jgi:hypothetical protein